MGSICSSINIQANDQIFVEEAHIPPATAVPEQSRQQQRIFSQSSQINFNSHQEGYQDQMIFMGVPLKVASREDLLHSRHRYIGALTFQDHKNRKCAGTGVLLSKSMVLTTAHNIYNKEYEIEYSDFKFYLGAQNKINDYYEIQQWRYLKNYKICKNDFSRAKYDYALLRLKYKKQRPINYNYYPALSSISLYYLTSYRNKLDVSIYGYPLYKDNYQERSIQNQERIVLNQYGLNYKNKISKVIASHSAILYTIDTLPGQSGSPIMVNQVMIGLHSGGSRQFQANVGLLFTNQMIKNLQKWRVEMVGHQFETIVHQIQSFDPLQIAKIIQNYSNKQMDKEDIIQIYERLGKRIEPIKIFKKQKNYMKLFECQYHENLVELRLSQNKLIKLNLSGNKNLQFLDLSHNYLKEVDISKNIQLIHANISNNELTIINVSENILLNSIDLSHNCLDKIDISKNIQLTSINIFKNQLQAINVSKNANLTNLNVSKNQISALDLQNNKMLAKLQASSNRLRKLNLYHNKQINWLDVSHNLFQYISLFRCIRLKYLNLSNNKLSDIDLSDNFALVELDLSHNMLIHINLASNEDLEIVLLLDNQLGVIDLSANKKIHTINLENNLLVQIVFYFNYIYLKKIRSNNFLENLCFGQQYKRKYKLWFVHDGEFQQEIIQIAKKISSYNYNLLDQISLKLV